jgi:hypothetical protein
VECIESAAGIICGNLARRFTFKNHFSGFIMENVLFSLSLTDVVTFVFFLALLLGLEAVRGILFSPVGKAKGAKRGFKNSAKAQS